MNIRRATAPSAALIVASLFALGAQANAQNFDNSGNGNLKGTYFVRQVLTANLDPNTSAIGQAVSITGTMTFDGNGNYTFTGQKTDSTAGSAPAAYTISKGTYALAANGLLQLQNPFDSTDIDYGGVGAIGPSAFVASATEGAYDDILVGIPISTSASNSSVQGSFQAGFIDFLQANASQVRDGYFTLTSNGSGSFGNVTVNGAMANQGSKSTTQNLTGVTYSFNNGTGTLTFPTASNPLTALVSGSQTLAVSTDGNILLGGAPNGFNLIVGIKSLSGATNSMYQGTYYASALENDASGLSNGNNFIDSFYGSTLALGQEDTINHYRLVSFNQSAYDYTSDGFANFTSNGTYNDGAFETVLGASGQAAFQVGVSTFYTLTVEFQSQAYKGNAPFITPVNIFNAASYAPITNSVAPGEFLTILGSGLSSSTTQAQSFPLPTNLGGVQVMVNGTAAPIDYVSPTQINFIVPIGTSNNGFATFQVVNNGATSNQVTVYTNVTAPGVFSLTSNGGTFPAGIGPAAVTHANGSLVTPSSPAVAGETLVLYVTGLGATNPSVADGQPAPSSPLSYTVETPIVEIEDQNANFYTSPNVTFSGLAPGFAGLYQINFVVPSGVPSGLQWVNVGTNEAYTSEAKIYMQ